MFSGKIKVMIVEDNKNYADFLRLSLSIYPEIEISGVAYNGVQVLSNLADSDPDVILLDIVMPNMNGIELLRHLNQKEDARPFVIVLSALSNPSITKQAIELGAKYILLKPVDSKTIVERIRTCMNTALMIQESNS